MQQMDHKLLKKSIRKGEQGIKSGRSIEETLVKRRLDVNNPLSWPTGTPTNPNLKALVLKPVFAGTRGLSGRRDGTTQPSSEGKNITPVRSAQTSEQEMRTRQIQGLLQQREILEHRVMQLEEMLIESDQQAAMQMAAAGGSRCGSRHQSRSRTSTPFPPGSGGVTFHGDSRGGFRDDPASQDVMTTAVIALDGIDERMGELQQLFHRDDPTERRHAAGTKITARVRGFLTRTRMLNYLRSMAEWRWSRCRHVVRCLDIMFSGQTSLDARIEQKQTIMETRLLRASFGGWKSLTIQNADKRKEIAIAAAEMLVERRIKSMRKGFLLLHRYTIGPNSSKQLLRERKTLAISLRHELSAIQMSKGLSGIVLPEDFKQHFRRRMVARSGAAKWLKLKRKLFDVFVGILRTAQWNEYLATKHWYRNCAGRCFYYWTEWNFQISSGLERKRWLAPRRYEVRYNQKRVDYFARLRVLKSIFKPWKEKQKIWREVNRRFRTRTLRFLILHFDALKKVVKTLRALRVNAVDNWKGYAVLLMTTPFQAWTGWVSVSKLAYQEKVTLATNYRKWKVRASLLIIVRTWRHQALYGRTDGEWGVLLWAWLDDVYARPLLVVHLWRVLTAHTLLSPPSPRSRPHSTPPSPSSSLLPHPLIPSPLAPPQACTLAP